MATKPTIDQSWTEPASDFKAKYPYNNATLTESGHLQEMDDTPGGERIRTQHKTGTYVEMQADGSEVHKIVGDGYEIVVKNKNVLISGMCHVTIEGDSNLHVKGNMYSQVDGRMYSKVNGDADITVVGDMKIASKGDIDIDASGVSGDITLSAGNAVNINGDLNVSGSIVGGSSITATYNITAGYKIFGIGGVETLGGMNIGFVSPGSVIPTGVVTSTSTITSPFILGGQVSDFKGTMDLMRVLYDSHNHPTPHGVSGLPTPLM